MIISLQPIPWVTGNQLRIVFTIAFAFTLFVSMFDSFGLKGNDNSHDPSALIKDGSKYWQFTTGDGIYAAYSNDLILWTAGPKTVFPIGSWPSWINSAVPGFAGTFWAPDCIYMNGKFYLYYSCSTFGSSRSAIGVATSASLDPNSSNYGWTDLGMVVSSASSSDINAIDPAMFRDSDGKVYMSYGSFSGGIGVFEIDPTTGKRKSGSTTTRVAGGGGADWEAPYIIKEGSYYYLFVNRGYCCKGTSSTYKIVMGRSSNVRGPYTDKAGVALTSNGGTTALATSGRYIGPGHFGLLRENGSNFVSIHYYDGNANGAAKLDVINMGFSGGWPFLTRDWIASGQYRITNKNSNKVWDAWGCTGAAGQSVAQGSWANLTCQKWNFSPVGDGAYRITNALGGRSVDIVNCGASNGTKLQLWDWLNNNCQKFEIERAADGSHVITPLNTTRVVEVPGALTTDGTLLALYDYNGHNTQKWVIASATTAASAREAIDEDEHSQLSDPLEVTVFPNPAGKNEITISAHVTAPEITVRIIDLTGKEIFVTKKSIEVPGIFTHSINVSTFPKGPYLITLEDSNVIRQKVRIVLE
jgi:arabinan endo-1,5-alpha-L-arabinosidase